MTTDNRARRWATAGTGLTLALSLAACGGNVGGGSAETAEYPSGPVTILVGADPRGSPGLIPRAAAQGMSGGPGVAVTVEKRPRATRRPSLRGPAPQAARRAALADSRR